MKLNENFLKYFGFANNLEDGLGRYFQYMNLPFRLNSACRVLTKLLRSPLDRWRRIGIRVFIHVDDGFGIVKGRENSVRASNKVRGDLALYGLLVTGKVKMGSKEKCHMDRVCVGHSGFQAIGN